MYFPSLFVLRNFNFKHAVHNWHAPILLKPFSLLQCHFQWIYEVYSVDARDQLTATAYSPKKNEGNTTENTFLTF